jgi:hypothetical protein
VCRLLPRRTVKKKGIGEKGKKKKRNRENGESHFPRYRAGEGRKGGKGRKKKRRKKGKVDTTPPASSDHDLRVRRFVRTRASPVGCPARPLVSSWSYVDDIDTATGSQDDQQASSSSSE